MSYHKDKEAWWVWPAVLVGVVILIICFWIFRSANEASVYNRLTGSSVTTWDAMWVELRVQAQPEKQK